MVDGENLGSAYASIEFDTSKTEAGAKKAQDIFTRALDDIGGKLDRLGQKITDFGSDWTKLTAPLAVGLGLATKTAIDFEESMQNVGAVLGINGDALDELSAKVLAVGENSKAGPQAVAEAYYDIVGGVADATAHMDILNAAVATAEAGNADLAGVTSALVSVMNSYKFEAKDAGKVSDVLTQIVAKGVGTMDEFASALPSVTGLANSMGISLEDLGANVAYLTTQGNTASQATTQLAAMMTALLNPNEKMKNALADLGYETGQAAVDALGLVGTYDALKKGKYGGEIAGLTGSVDALRGVTALTSDGVDDFLTTFKDGVAGATEAARAIQMDSTAASIDKAKASVQGLAIRVGDLLLPVIKELADKAAEIVGKIGDWIEQNPELAGTIAKIAAVAAVLGPILIAVGTAISAIGGVIAFVLSPIGLLIAAVVGLVAAFQNNFMGIRDVVQPVIDTLVQGFSFFTEAIGWFIQDIQNYGIIEAIRMAFGAGEAGGESWIEGVLATFGLARDTAISIVETMETVFNTLVTVVTDTVIPTVQQFADFLGQLWNMVAPALGQLADWFLTSVIPAIVDIVVNSVIPAVQSFIQWLGDIWAIVSPALLSLADWFLTTGLPAIQTFITDTVVPAIQTFIDTLVKVWNDVSPFLTQLFDWFINTGLPLIKDYVEGVVMPIIQAWIDLLVSIWNAVSPHLQSLYDWFVTTALPGIIDFMNNTVTPVIQGFIDLLKGIWGLVEQPLNSLKDGMKGIFDFIVNSVIKPVTDALGGIVDTARDALDALGLLPKQGLVDTNSTTAPTQQLFGIPSKDTGGPGTAGMPYAIGTGAQPEVFVPETNGQFIPNFDKVIREALKDALGGLSGNTHNLNIGDLHAMFQDTFESKLMEQLRGKGLS